MIDGDKAIEYLKNKLINLIQQGVINATYDESKSSISFYISDIIATNRPLLSLRLSNHHENFNNRKKNGRELPKGNDNISIELYKPQKGLRNKVKPKGIIYLLSPNRKVNISRIITGTINNYLRRNHIKG